MSIKSPIVQVIVLVLSLPIAGCGDTVSPICVRADGGALRECPDDHAIQCPRDKPLVTCVFDSDEATEGAVVCCENDLCVFDPMDTTDAVCVPLSDTP